MIIFTEILFSVIMHGIKRTLLLRIKLKCNNKHIFVRMYGKAAPIPWKRSVTGNYSMDFKLYKKLISENLGIDRAHVAVLLRNNLNLIGINEESMIRKCQICKDQQVDMQGFIGSLNFLELSEDDLLNRIVLLKEMGARYISPGMLRTCAGGVHMCTFKVFAKIPNSESVAENLYSHLDQPPGRVPPLEELDDYLNVAEYRRKCLTHWIKWRLEAPDNPPLIHSMAFSLRYKSFSRLNDTVDVLYNDAGMSLETIREKRYLTYILPDDFKKILTEIPVICGVPLRELWEKLTTLRRIEYENIRRAKELLEEFGSTAEQVLKCPKILLLPSDELEKGLRIIRNSEELKIFLDHPNLLQILLTADGLKARLDYLRYLNIRHPPIGALIKSPSAFTYYLRTGVHKHAEGEIVEMLQRYFNKDIDGIRMRMKKHLLWRHVDPITIHSTVEYLITLFSMEDIYSNLQLLFYPKDKVKFFLSPLRDMNESLDEADRYSPRQLLALCQYQIEREFHFTGEGVWKPLQDMHTPKAPCKLAPEIEERTECQAKYPLDDVNIFQFIKTNKRERLS